MTGDITFSSQITKQLQLDEGFRGKPYQDQVGKWTLGYGCNLDDEPLTEQEGTWLMWNRVEARQAKIRTQLPWTLNLDDARLGVLVNMSYQMGFGGLLEFRQMLAAMQAQDWSKAAAEMESSKWAQQVPTRAARLVKQMQTGEWQFNQ